MPDHTFEEANRKIAGAVTGGYRKIEEGVTGAFKKIEDGFVERFLTHEGETVEEAEERLAVERRVRTQGAGDR